MRSFTGTDGHAYFVEERAAGPGAMAIGRDIDPSKIPPVDLPEHPWILKFWDSRGPIADLPRGEDDLRLDHIPVENLPELCDEVLRRSSGA